MIFYAGADISEEKDSRFFTTKKRIDSEAYVGESVRYFGARSIKATLRSPASSRPAYVSTYSENARHNTEYTGTYVCGQSTLKVSLLELARYLP